MIARAAVAGISLGLLAAAAALQWLVLPHVPVVVHIDWTPWWALAAVALVVERYSVYFEWGGHGLGHSLVEMPILVGLAALGPHEFVLAFVAAQVVYRLTLPRAFLKSLYNVAFVWFELAVLVAVLGWVTGGVDVTDPLSWAVIVGVLVVTTVLGSVLVAVNVRLVGGDWRPLANPRVVAIEATAAAVSTTLAIVVVLALIHHPASLGLVAVLGAVLVAGYRRHRRATDRYELMKLTAAQLEDAAFAGGERGWTGVLKQVAAMFGARYAELTVFGADAYGGAVQYSLGGHGAVERRLNGEHVPLQERVNIASARKPAALTAAELPKDIEPEAAASGGLASPLVVGDQVIGLLLVSGRASQVTAFTKEHADELGFHAVRLGQAIAQGKLLERLHDEVTALRAERSMDTQTGLPTQSAFYEAMHGGAVRAGAFALISIANLAEINLAVGRDAGDRLMQDIAGALRARDLVAYRFPGAKFVVVLPDDAEASVARVQDALAVFAQPLEVAGARVLAELHTGIARLPEDGEDPNAVLESAALALAEARSRRERVVRYHAAARPDAVPAALLKGDLAAAILDGAIDVYFQPQVVLHSGYLFGAEALARWRHPEHGFVRPDAFVAIAEQAGLIHDLTILIMDKALAACREWHDAGYEIGVSVNLSAYDFRHEDLPARVSMLLERHGVLPRRVTLEITESVLMDDVARSLELAQALHDVGVRISVDDFGTGYSSLAYLARLPLDEIKIDRSFVTAIDEREVDATIVETLVGLGRKLNMTVVAEGVETGAVLRVLTAMGCDQAQGYFIARPMDAASFREWLRAGDERDWRAHPG